MPASGRILLIALALAVASLPSVSADHGAPHCEQAAFAEITSLSSGSTTVQVAGNTVSFTLLPTQAIVFSLDGGFWVDIDHGCLQFLQVTVLKNGQVAQSNGYAKKCDLATHHEWVPMGVETAEITVQVTWSGCDGTRGGVRGNGTAGDPPVFHPDGTLRL